MAAGHDRMLYNASGQGALSRSGFLRLLLSAADEMTKPGGGLALTWPMAAATLSGTRHWQNFPQKPVGGRRWDL